MLFLFPGLPDLRLIPDGGLPAVADNGQFQDFLMLQDLFLPGLREQMVQECQEVLVFAVRVKKGVQPAGRTFDAVELPFGEPFGLHVNALELDAPFLEPALGFPGVGALLRSENLNVHRAYLSRLPGLPPHAVQSGGVRLRPDGPPQ